jgi:hypothetical protein
VLSVHPGSGDRGYSKIAFLLLLVIHGTARAQPEPVDPMLVGQPVDFSHVVGKYRIEASAFPTEVAVEQPITLLVHITGEGPPKYEPSRENLHHLFPASWDKDFYVEEMYDRHKVDRATKTWTFEFRLRPKHVHIDAIEGIKLVYFDPRSTEKNKYRPAFAEDIKIVVKPRPAENSNVVVAEPFAPDGFYQLASVNVQSQPAGQPGSLPWLAVAGFLAGVPFCCLLGGWWWRSYHPDEKEQRRRRRGRAAEQALAQLRAKDAKVAPILGRYFQERFGLLLEQPTPAEVAAFFRRRGCALPLCEQCEALLQKCDAQRYARGAAAEVSMCEEAQRLIAALEADPCAR